MKESSMSILKADLACGKYELLMTKVNGFLSQLW